jgi:hypothetical protein
MLPKRQLILPASIQVLLLENQASHMHKHCLIHKSLKINDNNIMPKYYLLLMRPFKSTADPIVIQMNENCVNDKNLFMQDKQDRISLVTSLGQYKKKYKIQMTQGKVMENRIQSLILNCSKTSSVTWFLVLCWSVREGGNLSKLFYFNQSKVIFVKLFL